VGCGRDLPAFSTGTVGTLCPECHAAAYRAASLSPAPAPTARVETDLSSRFTPTNILIGINIAVFILMALSGVSAVSPQPEQLVKWGANYGPLSLGTQPWRILTSNYVHIGVLHIFFNMWCLLNLGKLAERIFDRWTYLLVYTFSGIAGSLASLWKHPQGVGAGASGAIFGLAGALIAALYLGKLPFSKAVIGPTLKSLIMFAAYNLFFGLVPGIDNSAHLGGLVSGLAMGAALAPHLTDSAESRAQWRNFVLAGMGLILLAFYVYLQRRAG
jgi:rhomboid protease GluP